MPRINRKVNNINQEITGSGRINLPPRVLHNEIDNYNTVYPNILRTGDSDRYKPVPTAFNDNQTHIFGEVLLDKFNNSGLGDKTSLNQHKWLSSGMEVNEYESERYLVFKRGSRWIQTNKKIFNPIVEIIFVHGPLENPILSKPNRLNLKKPSRNDTIKIQASFSSSGPWTNIKEVKPSYDTKVDYKNNKRMLKKSFIYLDFSKFKLFNGGFYLRIIQDSPSDAFFSFWAINKIKISMFKNNIIYPVGLSHNVNATTIVTNKNIAKPHITGTLITKGRPTESKFLKTNKLYNNNISPFNETNITEDINNDFFDIGTKKSVYPGFDSRLFEKTKIKIDLSTATATTFGMTNNLTSSQNDGASDVSRARQQLMVYWNNSLKRWEKISRGVSGGHRANTGSPLRSIVNASYVEEAACGFSSIGTVSSGSTSALTDQKLLPNSALFSYCRPTSTFGFPFHGKYHATGSQYILAKDIGINHPFLLEKCVLKFNAQFEFARPSDSGGDAYGLSYAFPSAGKPSDRLADRQSLLYMPTFFMLRQFNSKKDYSVPGQEIFYNYETGGSKIKLRYGIFPNIPGEYFLKGNNLDIATGNKNKVKDVRELITYGQISLYASGTTGTNVNIKKAIENGLGRDANYNISNNWNGSSAIPALTSSFQINFPCRMSSKISDAAFTVVREAGTDSAPTYRKLLLGNHYGGRLDTTLDGYSRTLASGIPTLDSNFSYFKIPAALQTNSPVDVFQTPADKISQDSPYIIMPNDKLIFGWQYPLTNNLVTASPGPNDVLKNMMTLLGQSELYFYGSLIHNNVEKHNTLNQELNTVSINETIIGSEIVDIFDNSSIASLTGSYVDKFPINSVIYESENINLKTKNRIGLKQGSKVNIAASVQLSNRQKVSSLQKNVKCFNQELKRVENFDGNYSTNYLGTRTITKKAKFYYRFNSYGMFTDMIEQQKDTEFPGYYDSPISVQFVSESIDKNSIYLKSYFKKTIQQMSASLRHNFVSSNLNLVASSSGPFIDNDITINRKYESADNVFVAV